METAGVSELKASLSEYLAKVKAGQEVLVTDRGQPVARIVPVTRTEERIPAHLMALERAGLVRIGKGSLPEGFWDRPRPKDPEGLALRALLAEREEGR
jgi:prevent-host-death family protein